ncbi:MAG: dTDP-4-dehydrorhamnose reductase [Leptolyngbya sp.]|nr:MAG: dTDP-4-dehydrorhamnose reductase [Leptolyngbya sp.]
MKLLLVGSQGQVGQELAQTLPCLGNVVALSREHLDLSQPDQIAAAVDSHQPDIVINAAAYTAVDKAESDATLAHQINALAPGLLAQAAADCGAAILHISTDYVFDGRQSYPYQETDATSPLGVYGQTKLAGEQAVQAANPRSLILRTAWVYGAKGARNFVKTMLKVGLEQRSVRVVFDQVGTPTWAYDIADSITALLPQMVDNDSYGIVHFTNSGVASWYDFATAIYEEAQAQDLLNTPPTVVPIATAEYPLPALRPAYSVLSPLKVSALLNRPIPHWRSSLRKMLRELARG